MKKILLLTSCFLLSIVFGFAQTNSKKTTKTSVKKAKKEAFIASNNQKPDSKTEELRKCHEENLKNSPFKETLNLSKKERKAMGIPPNKYYETEWELTMNPETGRPTIENLSKLRKQLADEKLANRSPGDAADNSWVERGPTNVGGRSRAVIFDPNDSTNETVFAGGVSGGLWKNVNISNPNSLWTRVSIPENLAVSCIVVDPNNSQIFYVGTGESYVGGDANGDGVWKSMDGGTSWVKVLGGISGPTYFQSASGFTVNSPSGIAGNYIMVEAPAAFGTFPPITTPITGDLAFQNDIPADPTATVCDPFPNPSVLSGKIALIRRGNCNFSAKVKAAQDAGAIAVIIMNNVTDSPFAMGGGDPLITIPSVMITQSDGNLLQSQLLSGNVNVTLNPDTGGFTGSLVPGIQHINAIKIRNNAGVSEVFVAAGDTNYGSSGSVTFLGGTSYGLYKSTNGGANWNELSLPLTAEGNKHCPNDIEIASDNKIWLSTTQSTINNDGGGIIFSSTDGILFEQKHVVLNGGRTQIAVSATNPDKIYVLSELSAVPPVGFTTTTDGFATTSSKALPVDIDSTSIPANDFTRGQAFYDLMLEVSPTNDQKVFIGGIDIFDSLNGGDTWDQKSLWTGSSLQDVHADQHAAAFAPGAPNKMVFGNDGGVYFSNDSGTTITSINNGFNVTQFYSVGVAPTTVSIGSGAGDNFVAGAQDNGSQMFLNATPGLNTADEVQGGDGAYSMFDQDGVDKYRVTNYVYNNRIQLYNYTNSSTRTINTETTNNGSFIAPMELDSKKDILYSDYTLAAANRVRRYKNIKTGLVQKALLTNGLLNSRATALKISPFVSATSTSTLLIGTRGGRLLKLENADNGTTVLGTAAIWTNLTGSGFAGSVSDIEYGASENEIFVTFHNYNVVSVWYTADGGLTWQNKEGNFPDIPVKCILRNPLNFDEVIIGTELGVWRTETFNTASPIWIQSQNGMQNVKVTDMDLRNDNVVYAATYGRGIFSGTFTANLAATNFIKTDAVKVYPNPSNGIYNLKIDKFVGKVTIQVVDINGRMVYNQTNENSEKTIDLSAFQSGIYVLKVTGNDLNYSEKLIKN
jgi:PA domain/Secretion system C-terminal sorting domain